MENKFIYGVLYRMIVFDTFLSENGRVKLNIIEKIILFHGLWYQRMKYDWFVFKLYCTELIIVVITYMWFMKRLVNNNQKWNIFAISKYNRIVNNEYSKWMNEWMKL